MPVSTSRNARKKARNRLNVSKLQRQLQAAVQEIGRTRFMLALCLRDGGSADTIEITTASYQAMVKEFARTTWVTEGVGDAEGVAFRIRLTDLETAAKIVAEQKQGKPASSLSIRKLADDEAYDEAEPVQDQPQQTTGAEPV